jgi:hypothetical protein
MNLTLKSLVTVVTFGIVLGACSSGKGPAAPKTPVAVTPATAAAGTNNPVYNVTLDPTLASQLGISTTAVCAQAMVTEDGDSDLMNFYAGACPTSNQVAAGSNAAFNLGLDNPSGDQLTYFLYDDAGYYVGQTNWVNSAFDIVQLCTGNYALSTLNAGPPPDNGNDACKITTNSSQAWTGIVNGANTSLSL